MKMSKLQGKEQNIQKEVIQREANSTAIQNMAITAVFIALTFVITTYINVRIPFIPANGGLVHLGNVPVFLAAAVFGKKTGALTGAIGLGLFDLLNGWVTWAPFTFLICGLIGYVYGWITEKNRSVLFQIIAVFAAVVIKVAGYYAAEGILYANWVAPALSIPGNIVQIVTAGIIAVPLTLAVGKVLQGIAND
jgi:uncharacterized membrane protein